jgi:hypothetical protein
MSSEMHLESVTNRLSLLNELLVYDSEVEKVFTVVDRIMINQERGALFDFVNYLFGSLPHEKVRTMRVPVELEQRIQQLRAKNIVVTNPIIIKQE